jgi:hypothetical protein
MPKCGGTTMAKRAMAIVVLLIACVPVGELRGQEPAN